MFCKFIADFLKLRGSSHNATTATNVVNVETSVNTILKPEIMFPHTDFTIPASAERKGDRHVNQDASKVRISDNSIAIAVCDGVSGAFRSQYAALALAEIATKHRILSVEDFVKHKDDLFQLYREGVDREFQDKTMNFYDRDALATDGGQSTIASIVVDKNGDLFSMRGLLIGDTTVVIHKANNIMEIYPKNIEYSSNTTMFRIREDGLELGSSHADKHLDITEIDTNLESGDSIVIMTDGIANAWIDSYKKFGNRQQLEEDLKSLVKTGRAEKIIEDDDATAVIVHIS